MADFSTWFYSLVTGTDLETLQQQIDAEQAQASQMAMNDYAPGGKTYNQIEATQGRQAADKAWQTVQGDYQSGHVGNVTQDVANAFSDGLNQGTQNVKGFFAGLIDKAFAIIPWQAWILGIVALFIWLGGLQWLKRFIARK